MQNEEKTAELNEQYSRIKDLQATISASDLAALEYVKSLPGFKAAYPELSAAHDAAAEELSGAEAEVENGIEWADLVGQWLDAGKVVNHDGGRYEVIQGHFAQEHWRPEDVPALYRYLGGGQEEWPEFIQPTGAHDAYAKGAKVTYKSRHYISLIDANVYSPEAYPQGWQLAD